LTQQITANGGRTTEGLSLMTEPHRGSSAPGQPQGESRRTMRQGARAAKVLVRAYVEIRRRKDRKKIIAPSPSPLRVEAYGMQAKRFGQVEKTHQGQVTTATGAFDATAAF